ncbi:MAG: TerB family tellurite resistance protein [Proteobacteria bacterium]|nr:TerB family tellurite resistance protein [Pseudomonadota bacterium]
MLDRLKSMFSQNAGGAAARSHDPDELQLAAAALLVEAARMDDDYDADERALIGQLLRDRFDLDALDAEALLVAADAATVDLVEVYGFARQVKDAFEHEERVQMIEMLWEVVCADGEIHDHEANLLRRVAGLIYVSDRESGDARKRVLDRSRAAS